MGKPLKRGYYLESELYEYLQIRELLPEDLVEEIVITAGPIERNFIGEAKVRSYNFLVRALEETSKFYRNKEKSEEFNRKHNEAIEDIRNDYFDLAYGRPTEEQKEKVNRMFYDSKYLTDEDIAYIEDNDLEDYAMEIYREWLHSYLTGPGTIDSEYANMKMPTFTGNKDVPISGIPLSAEEVRKETNLNYDAYMSYETSKYLREASQAIRKAVKTESYKKKPKFSTSIKFSSDKYGEVEEKKEIFDKVKEELEKKGYICSLESSLSLSYEVRKRREYLSYAFTVPDFLSLHISWENKQEREEEHDQEQEEENSVPVRYGIVCTSEELVDYWLKDNDSGISMTFNKDDAYVFVSYEGAQKESDALCRNYGGDGWNFKPKEL